MRARSTQSIQYCTYSTCHTIKYNGECERVLHVSCAGINKSVV